MTSDVSGPDSDPDSDTAIGSCSSSLGDNVRRCVFRHFVPYTRELVAVVGNVNAIILLIYSYYILQNVSKDTNCLRHL